MRTKFEVSIAVAAIVVSLCVFGAAMAAADVGDASSDAAFHAAEAWAFSRATSPDPSAPKARDPDPRQKMHFPGSARSYTWGELATNFVAPDWFPEDHPPAPHVVLFGRKPAWACGACHYPNGAGDTTSASLAGLPKTYILEQIAAFRSGERGQGAPEAAQEMAREAHNLDDADLQQAADYFSGLKLPAIRRVVETEMVPKTHWDGFALAPNHNGAREPIGERIIEVPEDQQHYAWGDERTGFLAYVPPGSIARGAVIAANGKGSAASCGSCHGPKLEGQTMPGIGVVPPLAGRSPTYIARELILFREGKRTNGSAAPMRAEAAQLTLKDMIDVAAYAASRKP
jgi:cytochrome c553